MSSCRDIMLLGGSGFIGGALLRELSSRGDASPRVHALLRRPSAVPDAPHLTKVEGCLEAPPTGLEPNGPYVLVHLAVKQFDHDGSGFFETNVAATERLLSSLGENLRGILYASSMGVYGPEAQEGVTEGLERRPDTPLGESRRAAEDLVFAEARRRGIPAYVLRPRFIVGRGDRFVLPGLLAPLRRGVGVGDGAQAFSIIDVDDYARIVLKLCDRAIERDASASDVRRALHVAYRRPARAVDIEAALADGLGLRRPRIRVPIERLSHVLHRLPTDSSRRWATRLDLVGRSHYGDVTALEDEIGHSLLSRDPREALTAAVRTL